MEITVGMTFYEWTVIGAEDEDHKGRVLCRCSCGTKRWVWKRLLEQGKSKSCGCRAHMAEKDYGIHPGDHIGYWTILSQQGRQFVCQCVCGAVRLIQAQDLLRGKSKSCGCKRWDRVSPKPDKGSHNLTEEKE